MTTSPPSATTGSSLYMPLAAVQMSSYIGGMMDRTRLKGRSTYLTCTCADSAAASAHAASGEPVYSPARQLLPGATTIARQILGVEIIEAARLIRRRTGVTPGLPMIA